MDYFYAQRDRTARLKQRANDLFRLLMNTTERITKRIANQKNELKDCEKKEDMKLKGSQKKKLLSVHSLRTVQYGIIVAEQRILKSHIRVQPHDYHPLLSGFVHQTIPESMRIEFLVGRCIPQTQQQYQASAREMADMARDIQTYFDSENLDAVVSNSENAVVRQQIGKVGKIPEQDGADQLQYPPGLKIPPQDKKLEQDVQRKNDDDPVAHGQKGKDLTEDIGDGVDRRHSQVRRPGP